MSLSGAMRRKRAQPLFSPTRARPSKRLRTTGGTTRAADATRLGDHAEEWVPEPRPGGRHGWLVLLAGAARDTRSPTRSSSWAKLPRPIAGDAPQLAMERRRRSCSLLLLSPAIGQPAGELCKGEIGRRGAVEQCRHDPG